MLIVNLALATGDGILICDPEREYASLIEAMGGEVIRIAAGSRDHINAMDMVEGYGDSSDPTIEKSEFVLSLFEQLDPKGIGPNQRSLIDRCTGEFFNSAWRRFRKRNAFPTAITQNVEYLLDSVLASTMLSNSEYIVMLNQAASDRQKLADLLNISNEQLSYITNADAGCGLIKYGSSLVPFVNQFPKNTRLYKLMTTKPGEDGANRNR